MSIVVSLHTSRSEELTSSQFLLSQALQDFCGGATRLEGLSTFAIAQMVFPLAKGFSLRCFSSLWKSSRAALALSTGTACFAEAASLATTPILFQGKWEESIGIPQGFFHSLATVGVLRGVGYYFGGAGFLLQVTQTVGLVCINRAIGETPSQGFVTDCMVASVTTVQNAASGNLLHHFAPGVRQFAVREELRMKFQRRISSPSQISFWEKMFPPPREKAALAIPHGGETKISLFLEEVWKQKGGTRFYIEQQPDRTSKYISRIKGKLERLKQKHIELGFQEHPLAKWRKEDSPLNLISIAKKLNVDSHAIRNWEEYKNLIPSDCMDELQKLGAPTHLFEEQNSNRPRRKLIRHRPSSEKHEPSLLSNLHPFTFWRLTHLDKPLSIDQVAEILEISPIVVSTLEQFPPSEDIPSFYTAKLREKGYFYDYRAVRKEIIKTKRKAEPLIKLLLNDAVETSPLLADIAKTSLRHALHNFLTLANLRSTQIRRFEEYYKKLSLKEILDILFRRN